MNNEEAIGILKEELHHTEFHLHDKNKAPEFYEEMGRYCEALKMAINALNNERPKGEWKHIIDEYNDVECPFCGFQEDGIYYNFCPGCGADMRGAE